MSGILAQSLGVLTADVPAGLVNHGERAKLNELAAPLPAVLAGGLEVRLADEARVDLQLNVAARSLYVQRLRDFLARAGEDRAGEDPAADALPASWRALRPLLASLPSAAGEGTDAPLGEIWLEFDEGTADDLAPLSIFCGFKQAPTDDPGAVRAVLDACLPAETGAGCRAGVERCFAACREGAFISHIGLMLGRDSDAVRVNVKRLTPATLGPYLAAVGWPGAIPAAVERLGRALEAADKVTLCLDVGPEVREPFGLEYCLEPESARRGRWADILDHAIPANLVVRHKRDAVLAWPGAVEQGTVPGWPRALVAAALAPPQRKRSVFARSISHIKLTCAGGLPVAAKAYLWFSHTFQAPEVRS